MHNNSNSTFALIKNLVPRQHLQQWKPAEPASSNKKSLIKWFYFFRSTPEHLPVRVSNIAYKDYDPGTGNKILNNYMILREIGRGMHGKVKLAQDLDTGELVAIKVVDKQSRKRQLGYGPLRKSRDTDGEQRVRREIAILQKCVHPHVVRLQEVIDDYSSKKIYMVLEYMEGGEIVWRTPDDEPALSVSQARQIFRDLVSGLDYIHYQGIIHRDIKPSNLLYTKDNRSVKISDFGVSYFNERLAGPNAHYDDNIEKDLEETAGTPAFFAPELCSPQHLWKITKAIDVWAAGVTLYCLLYGQCPFTAASEYELFEVILNTPLVFPDATQVGFETSDDLKDLLSKLLEKDPEKRITLDQVKFFFLYL
ncbi:Putative CAMKK/ELM protein kinase [Rhizopus microsporus]|nr:Putative CAMKK/ELM protein kinase [Rhizopus microsporus]